MDGQSGPAFPPFDTIDPRLLQLSTNQDLTFPPLSAVGGEIAPSDPPADGVRATLRPTQPPLTHYELTTGEDIQSIPTNSDCSLMQPDSESTPDQGEAGEHTSSRRAIRNHQIAPKIGGKDACTCGKTFTRVTSLRRHIQTLQDGGEVHPCPECSHYTGNKSFKRKDHLYQHLQHAHGKSPKQISDILQTKLPFGFTIPFCHFPGCDGYFEPSLVSPVYNPDQAFKFGLEFRKHMRNDHEWSPYPCDVYGCDKAGGNGFYDFGALTRHRIEEHPSASAAQKPNVVLKREEYWLCEKCYHYFPLDAYLGLHGCLSHRDRCTGAIPESGQVTT